jgi:hypothetical protein
LSKKTKTSSTEIDLEFVKQRFLAMADSKRVADAKFARTRELYEQGMRRI